ncbi:MAG: phosphoribosylformylglycinamidine synthase subunit PurS [Thermanaerothrix sp.]|nr:phosphoribosylformylglycinamidine synthase subunit PurS [Thermanaerothrix sp.]
MLYTLSVLIRPKDGVLDTQGRAVMSTLRDMGNHVLDVSVGKFIRLTLEASDEKSATEAAQAMCRDLLCNEMIETFCIKAGDLSQ